MRHYINLTRGLFCPHMDGCDDPYFTRIQSTACEQKLWPAVLSGVGPDLLTFLAAGGGVVVHDLSEKDRETRAMWQGLKFIKRACETFWDLPLSEIDGRGGKPMQDYFDVEIASLPTTTKRQFRYYRQFNPTQVNLVSCYQLTQTQ